jgi:hypothetical protein
MGTFVGDHEPRSDEELQEALIWLYASDCGLTARVGDEPSMRTRCRHAIWDRLVTDEVGLRQWLSRLARDVFLSEAALQLGHGIDDACEFWSWFDETMWTLPESSGLQPD